MQQQANSTDKKTKAENALIVALDIRKFEIDLYWRRAAYFWAFLALILGSYFAVLTATVKELQCHPLLKSEVLLIISCFGIVFSIAWYFVNRASKFWQENWEKHVDLLENSVHGPLYKTVLSNDYPCFQNLMQPYPFSVSKINQVLSLVTIFGFFLLALMTFLTALLSYIGRWPSVSASKCLAIVAMIVTAIATGVIVSFLYRCGQSKQAKEKPKNFAIEKYKTDFDLTKTETETSTELKSKNWVWDRT